MGVLLQLVVEAVDILHLGKVSDEELLKGNRVGAIDADQVPTIEQRRPSSGIAYDGDCEVAVGQQPCPHSNLASVEGTPGIQ